MNCQAAAGKYGKYSKYSTYYSEEVPLKTDSAHPGALHREVHKVTHRKWG